MKDGDRKASGDKQRLSRKRASLLQSRESAALRNLDRWGSRTRIRTATVQDAALLGDAAAAAAAAAAFLGTRLLSCPPHSGASMEPAWSQPVLSRIVD